MAPRCGHRSPWPWSSRGVSLSHLPHNGTQNSTAPSTSWYLKPGWACGPGFDVVAKSQDVENRKILEVSVLLPYWNTIPWRPQEHSHLLVGEERSHLCRASAMYVFSVSTSNVQATFCKNFKGLLRKRAYPFYRSKSQGSERLSHLPLIPRTNKI